MTTTAEHTEKTLEQQNRDWCKRIAETFEAYAFGNMHECPHCEEIFEADSDENDTIKCPDCGKVLQFEDYTEDDYAEEMTLDDYLEDVLDIEITRSGLAPDSPIKGVRVCVAFGGPNIYIDTREQAAKLYWWCDRAEYPIDKDACNELEDYIEELAACY